MISENFQNVADTDANESILRIILYYPDVEELVQRPRIVGETDEAHQTAVVEPWRQPYILVDLSLKIILASS
jgi:hypothetical protein